MADEQSPRQHAGAGERKDDERRDDHSQDEPSLKEQIQENQRTSKLRQSEKKPKPNPIQNPSTSPTFPLWLLTLKTTLLLILSSAACLISQLSLSPIYGTIPASTWHRTIQLQAVLISAVPFFTARTTSAAFLEKCLPLHAAAGPPLLHYVLAPLSTRLGPSHGPLATELVLLLPILVLTHFVIRFRLASLVRDDSWLAYVVPLSTLVGGQVIRTSSSVLQFFYDWNVAYYRHDLWLTRWALQSVLIALLAILSPSKLSIALLPTAFFQSYINPHAPLEHNTVRLNTTLQRDHGFILRERIESNTGYLSVLESIPDAHRVLRCDHSLLGGNWLPTPERQKEGITVAEPIYPVFTMLEAVRLIEHVDDTPIVRSRGPEKALVIGLGIGTAPKALSQHGIRTTVLELDPEVTAMARRWFDLPHNVSVRTADAHQWVRRDRQSYDYVIHDVFTGGAEPLPLFEHDFLMELTRLLEMDGKAAINYAGDLTDLHTLDVLETISSVFSDNCKFYRDNPRPDTYTGGPDFANVVAFCANARRAHVEPPSWNFRDATEEDFLDSVSRRQSLPPRHAVNFKEMRRKHPEVVGGSRANIDQTKSAENHWRIMRQVLPAKIWELY